MEVFIEREGRKEQIEFEGKVRKLLEKIKVNPSEVLVVVNDELATEDDVVKKGDKVKLLSVISGG
ncbi:MAG: MoaD/ThiS family protein [Candidatus Woesearchaeota archaeon]